MDETVLKIAMGGLLHDIGKFMQRAELEKDFVEIKNNYDGFCPILDGGRHGYLHAAHAAYFIEELIPENIIDKTDKAELYNAARHHKNPSGDIYREADHLSAGMERYEDEKDSDNYKKVRLHSIFDAVELQYAIHDKENRLNSRWRYSLTELSSNKTEELYPVMIDDKGKVVDDGFSYKNQWSNFSKDLSIINRHVDKTSYFNDLYWLLEKYTWCIPSATNAFPDIPLFDHLKTTAAIASCFYFTNQENIKKKPHFILYGGDLSGIQDYIFRISSSQGIGGISKRLRGRSFYIAMLTEIFSRYAINTLNLTVANVNFCGGGNFEILLPNTQAVVDFLYQLTIEINEWLVKEFHGSLGYVDASVEMTREDLRDNYGEKKDALSDKLQGAKLKKSYTHLDEGSFWVDRMELAGKISVCPSCNLKLIRDNEKICELCQQDKDIGSFLPKTEYLAFSQSEIRKQESCKTINFGKFGTVILLGENSDPLALSENSQTMYALSEHETGVIGRYFIAQTLPTAKDQIGPLETEKDDSNEGIVYPGQTLSFSTLADMAEGDKRIGILKMDVDNLGLIFSLGLDTPPTEKEKGKNLRSISRLSTLSRQMSFFFTAHIDELCRQVFGKWQNDKNNKWPYKKDVSSIFYLIFAGGDDLVIVGPWDRIIELARKVRKAFKDFTCHNPNISLSAGIYICKPKFPISIAAGKAEEALKQSKVKGRNRITIMEETFVWDKEDERSRVYQKELRSRYPGALFDEAELHSENIYLTGKSKKLNIKTLTFEELSKFAEQLQAYYEGKSISRHFIFRLLKAREEFFTMEYNSVKHDLVEDHNYMFLPHLLHNIERNTSGDAKRELKGSLVTTAEAQTYIRQAYYPCKSVLMKTKK
ncbi:MAG: type III-A CRISPR-associated protein Cas10/Csm1 [Proteobacteria bacterium]|nr:type III-A CRISPR-associated protein Cas10/Csm1 [Pseudomonadota bacterium]